MRRATARAALAMLAGALAAAALPSTAQAALGDGLPMGPVRLHLGVETDLTYDTEAGVGQFAPLLSPMSPGDLVAVFRGLIGLEGKSEKFKLKLVGDVNWNQFMGIVAQGTQGLSYLGANVQGTLQMNPEGKAGVDVTESFARTNTTTNPVFGIGVLSLLDDTKIRLRFRPGGGAIEFGITGDAGINLYAPQFNDGFGAAATGYSQCGTTGGTATPGCNPALAAAYNAWFANGAIDVRWRFLPKTGVMLDANIGTWQYVYGNTPGSSVSAAVPNLNAMPYEVLLGFGTLLTTRFSFTVKAGYQGITFPTQVTANYGTVAGLADIGFKFSESASARLGFNRSTIPVGGPEHWYGDNRFFLELTLTPVQRLTIYGIASVDLINYGSDDGRQDQAIGATARIDYNILKWLKIIGKIDVSTRSSNEAMGDLTSGTAAYDYTIADVSIGLAALF